MMAAEFTRDRGPLLFVICITLRRNRETGGRIPMHRAHIAHALLSSGTAAGCVRMFQKGPRCATTPGRTPATRGGRGIVLRSFQCRPALCGGWRSSAPPAGCYHGPPAPNARISTMNRSQGRFALVLHSHIPFVLRHGRWPHGTDWICEAAAESYLPILAMLGRLERDHIPSRLTLTMSPVLCEQLADPDFTNEFEVWAKARREQLARDARTDGQRASLAGKWSIWIEEMLQLFHQIDGNIPAAYRALEDRGRIEVATCAATHGYLPLLSRDESINLQLQTAVHTHEKHFGKRPRGIWLPECAYRPRYEWTPPIGRDAGKVRAVRPGIEEQLSAFGLHYFVADAHMVHAGDPLSIYRNYYSSLASLRGFEERFPQYPKTRTPFEIYDVKSRGSEALSAALIREPRTSLQIWSREEGYPGDRVYLDFHKRDVANGVRYHRVSGPGVPDAQKEYYDPDAAATRAEEHSRHFVWLVGEALQSRSNASGGREPGGIVCSPFDTELFGHWWFEGPLFLEHVFRNLARTEIAAVSGADALDLSPKRESVQLLEGSWGEGGDHRAWLNKDTEWTWDRLYDAESDVVATMKEWKRNASAVPDETRQFLERAVRQALRELLLLQSSDWQFLITTRAARDYAERRFATHYVELKRLLDLARRGLATHTIAAEDTDFIQIMERRDRAFMNLDIQHFA